MQDFARHVVFKTLLPFEKATLKDRLHVDAMLDQAFEHAKPTAEDRRFAMFLCYGTLKQWFALTDVLMHLSHMPLTKLSPTTRVLLRMGLFQLSEMNSVPDYAAVSSTLDLAEAFKLSQKTRGFINAILNTFIRQGKVLPSSPGLRFPAWWYTRLLKQYTASEIQQMEDVYQQIPSNAIRVNLLKTTVEAYKRALVQADIAFEQSIQLPEVLFLNFPGGSPIDLPGFAEGWFVVQNESSAVIAPFLDPHPGETVIEIGAAPGMKTTHMAALMQNQGRLLALDNSPTRLKRLEENITRLGVTIVEAIAADAHHFAWHESPVDRVLIDAPCSGTGTLIKNPEILLVLKEEVFSQYAAVQLSLLNQGFTWLKPSGILVYSTCSIDTVENEQVVAQFLSQHPEDVCLLESRKIMISQRQHGFFMAKFQKTVNMPEYIL